MTDMTKLSQAELIALIAALKARPANRLSLKVTEPRAANPAKNDKGTSGGAISCYGLGRFPVTLYRSQWERLLEAADDIRAFITANADRLATKD